MKRHFIPLVLVAALAVFAAGCGDDDDSTATATDETTTTSTGEDASSDDGEGALDGASDPDARSHTEMSAEELEVWQTDLNAVGCWVGAIDGELGPQTESAITAFQAAKGLVADGLLGPVTEAALQEAVAAGETVCTDTTSGEAEGGEGSSSGDTATVSASSYDKTFSLGTCSLDGELVNAYLAGEADGTTFEVEVVTGTGTLSVSGSTETDGITLNGDVTDASIGADRSFTINGTFADPNFAGESFTISGSCPE